MSIRKWFFFNEGFPKCVDTITYLLLEVDLASLANEVTIDATKNPFVGVVRIHADLK